MPLACNSWSRIDVLICFADVVGAGFLWVGSRRGQALPLSRDHRPTVPEERERILRAGARVAGPHGKYVMLPRREVGLSLSRSIGDRLFKECNGAVVATPDVITITISPGDEFLLLGCDGA